MLFREIPYFPIHVAKNFAMGIHSSQRVGELAISHNDQLLEIQVHSSLETTTTSQDLIYEFHTMLFILLAALLFSIHLRTVIFSKLRCGLPSPGLGYLTC